MPFYTWNISTKETCNQTSPYIFSGGAVVVVILW